MSELQEGFVGSGSSGQPLDVAGACKARRAQSSVSPNAEDVGADRELIAGAAKGPVCAIRGEVIWLRKAPRPKPVRLLKGDFRLCFAHNTHVDDVVCLALEHTENQSRAQRNLDGVRAIRILPGSCEWH